MRLVAVRCPRCLRMTDPWPLRRADNCGTGAYWCIRTNENIAANWYRLTPGAYQRIARKVKALR